MFHRVHSCLEDLQVHGVLVEHLKIGRLKLVVDRFSRFVCVSRDDVVGDVKKRNLVQQNR
jgi:hypothetical protein